MRRMQMLIRHNVFYSFQVFFRYKQLKTHVEKRESQKLQALVIIIIEWILTVLPIHYINLGFVEFAVAQEFHM